MKFKGIIILFWVVNFILPFPSFAQKDQLKQGNVFFEAGKYQYAINAYNKYKKTEKDPKLLIKRGICYLKNNQPDECIRDMSAAHQLKSLDNTRFMYIAMAYFAKGEYEESARFFKTYLNTLKPNTYEWFKTIASIKKCGFAKNKKYSPQIAFVENLGSNVNTEFDEFNPTKSPTKVGRYYFSSTRSESTGGLRNKDGLSDIIKGNYYTDIFYVDLKDGNWSIVLPIDNLINTSKHELIQDFNSDGSVIYYTKSNDFSTGILYTDTFMVDKDLTMLPTPIVNLPFKAEIGDKDLHYFNDSIMIFSSQRKGGFGGFDIYYAVQTNNGWSDAINFGPSINSPYNEICPYLTKNSKFIYFSSDRPETLGGYDIFKSEFNNNSWGTSVNLYYPINSPGDDLDIEISSDGMTAIFSSNRIGSKGGFDLYIAYFKDQIIDQLEYTEKPLFLDSNDLVEKNIKSVSVNTNTSGKEQTQSKIHTIEIVGKPLFFSEEEDVLNNVNTTQLKRIADIMMVYPNIKILLHSHYSPESKKEIDVYFSIKRAEKVAEHLKKLGVRLDRIYLNGCGANFPLATPYVNGIPSSLAEKTNKRIDYNIISDSTTLIKMTYDMPVVAEQYRDTKWDSFQSKNLGVTFRVHFAEVTQMLVSEAFNNLPDIIIEKRADQSKYIYSAGNVQTFSEAKNIQEILTSLYIYDTKIVPYYQGMPLDDKEIETLKSDYPQLWYLKN